MKSFVIAALCFVSSSAFAGEYFASRTTAIYFAPRPSVITVGILKDGSIVGKVQNGCHGRSGPDCMPSEDVYDLGSLSESVLSKLSSEFDKLKYTEPVDTRPDTPMCSDYPTTTYLASKSNSEEDLKIAQLMGCHKFLIPYPGVDRQIIDLLDGYGSILNLLRR